MPSTAEVNIAATEASSYEYHGGSAPPPPTDRVVLPEQEEETLKEAVVQEHVRDVEIEEIQPVVERERIVTEVQQVVQPVLDVVNEAPVVEEAVLEQEEHKFKEKTTTENLERYEEQANAFKDEQSHVVVHETVYKEPVIHETVKHKIIKEVQPVIERVVTKTHVIQETQPIKETFVKAPIVHEQEIAAPITMDEFRSASRPRSPSPLKTPLKDVLDSHPLSTTTSSSPLTPPRTTRSRSTSKSPSRLTSRKSTSPGPMTRLKRKKLAEAAEDEDTTATTTIDVTQSATVEEVDSEGDVVIGEVSQPSVLHGRLEKVLGTVEAGLGELVGSDRLVEDGESRVAEGEAEIEAAQAAKRRRVEV
ncbi:hypothetical protein HDV00_004297 [Rhizophlyctis rosea]|nr:hypothetical protein HDV00_004297 [Rhizophlyctis rosea]